MDREGSVVIALSLRPAECSWSTLVFPTTLFTCAVLDLLIADVPPLWQAEVRLGLQEALINAVKHGNCLDPSKQVVVEYSHQAPIYQWLISDQGKGFSSQHELHRCGDMRDSDERGRGTFILTQIFDFVKWNDAGNQLYLGKHIHHAGRAPLIC